MHMQTIMMLIGIIGSLPPAFALFEFEFKCKAKVARAYDEAFGTPACGQSVPARNPWYLGATLLPSSLHMLAGIPFELGLGAVCFAMTLVLTIPIYGIHLAIRSGGRSVRALVRSKARLGFVSTRIVLSRRRRNQRVPGAAARCGQPRPICLGRASRPDRACF